MKMSNPFEMEMKCIDQSSLDRKAQIKAVWELLRKNVEWNKTYRLFCEKSAKKLIDEKSGSNADLNFILMAMLRSLDIPAVPVVMSTRRNGILPLTSPSINDLTSFVICVFDGEKLCYIDASTDNFLFNILDPNLLSKNARVLQLGKYNPRKTMEALYGKESYSQLESVWGV